MPDFRYKAFVSYSWADAAWGKWLHQAIETYRTPAALIGKDGANGPVPARLHPLFKDREEEAAGSSIGNAVGTALDASEFLIVICSPRSAQSQWVNREIAWFKSHRDPDRILALIVDGEPGGGENECFPRALTHHVADDLTVTDIPIDTPLAADARVTGDGKRGAKLKLAAAMLGVGLDELINRDERRRTLRTRIVVASSVALALVMSGMAWFAIQERNQARVQRGQAEGLVEFMITDLRKTLQPKVQIEVLGSIAKRAQAFYAIQSKYSMDDDALGRRSRMLKLLADIETDQGRTDVSFGLMIQSVAASSELLARDPDNPDRILEQAFSLQGLGNLLFQRGDLQGAEANMQQAVGLTTHLVDDVGRKDEWLAEQASALANLGITQFQQRRLAPASANLQQALAIMREVLGRSSDGQRGRPEFASTLAWAAEAAATGGDDAAALRYRLEEEKVYLAMLQTSPDDQFAQAALNANRFKQADALLRQGQFGAALSLARQADAASVRSQQADPGNTSRIEDAANAHAVLGEAELASGNLLAAARAATAAQALAERLVRTDPTIGRWDGPMLGAARLLTIRVAARSASSLAACRVALEPAIAEANRLGKLAAARPTDAKLALVAAQAEILRGDHAALSGRSADARAAWIGSLAILNRVAGAGAAPRDQASGQLTEQLATRIKRGTVPSARSVGANRLWAICG